MVELRTGRCVRLGVLDVVGERELGCRMGSSVVRN
jgi:hypothetical protein